MAAAGNHVNRRVLCTAATGPHLELFDVTGPALRAYAERHGYELVTVHERLARGRPAAWDKVALLDSLLATNDLAVWIDADAMVRDGAPDIASALRPRRFMHLAVHHTAQGVIPNTGVLALRGGGSSRAFLRAVWHERRFVHDRWWENAAINHLLGYRSVPVAGVRRVVPSRWHAGVGILDRAWNSIPEDPSTAPYITHYPGIPLEERLRRLGRDAAA